MNQSMLSTRFCKLGKAFPVLLPIAYCNSGRSEITGQWNFDDPNAPLAANIGTDLEYFDGPGGATEAGTRFGTTTELGIPDIDGSPARVMEFPQTGPTSGYKMFHGASASGNGFLVNQWTLIIDLMFPTSSSGTWRALIQSDSANFENDDAEFYLNESNGLGIGGQYDGVVPPNTWVRIAIAVDNAATPPVISKYIDGTIVGEQGGGLDGRFALNPSDTPEDAFSLLFTDGYAGGIYSSPGYVGSIQFHDEKLSEYPSLLWGDRRPRASRPRLRKPPSSSVLHQVPTRQTTGPTGG